MTRPFRFAIQTGPFSEADELRQFAQVVESLGYDELYSYDHVGMRDNMAVDPFLPLLVAAEATSRLRFGPLVLNNEFHHPALLARTAVTFDRLTGGRLVLGLGTGYAQVEHDAIGLELRAPGPRVGRFGESLAVLRALCDDGACSFSGDHHQVDIESLGVSAAQPSIPFLIGGHGKRVVSLAARYADIFQFTGLIHGEDGTPTAGGFPLEDVRRRADWLVDAAGDRSDVIERSVLVQFTAVGDDAPSASSMADRFKHPADVVEHTPFVLSGSVEQIVDKLERQRQSLGASHYVVRDPEGFAPIVEALAGR